jgi:hypothetical protein
MHRRLRPWWLPLRATVLPAPPRAPAASYAAPYPREPRQLHVDHGYPRHDIIDHDYSPSVSASSTLAQKGYHPHEFLTGFVSNRSVCTTPTFQLWGDVSLSALAYGFFSSLTVCGAPAVTAGEC